MTVYRNDKPSDLHIGLYETVLDRDLGDRVSLLPSSIESVCRHLDPAESHIVLARYIATVLQADLHNVSGERKVQAQAEICNAILRILHEHTDETPRMQHEVVLPPEQLLAILPIGSALAGASTHKKAHIRPETPLASSCLLTGTRIDPSLVSQLRKEMHSADQIDILCSFVKWSGIRVLEPELRAFTSRDGVKLRIITTSYMGATDPRAIKFLAALPNTEVRISYDTKRTRLHAKAYLIHRKSEFGAAYVGSANLSHAAITDGLEWNVKISQAETPHLWHKAVGTFETYWNDPEFVGYAPAEHDRFAAAIVEERSHGSADIAGFQFDIRPYGYQQEIIDRLEAERTVHGSHRNLIVAATGTGKTVIAAMDYRKEWQRYAAANGHRKLRLLFVAHREEILKQSLGCFRAVLKDHNFGDLLVGDFTPQQQDHLFVSIQTWNSRKLAANFSKDHFDYVVVDEFHRAEAPSYDKLLQYVTPKILLGLTATPERADGLDILHHFAGRIAAEIRLPDAINRKLLSPFQYFGVTDPVDLSTLRWHRGGYIPAELDEQYTGNDARADLVVRSVKDKLTDYRRSRGLGFCISVRHAEYMAGYFNRAGIPALALTGGSSREIRNAVQRKLLDREINFIFTVDLYNEGVDIPHLDTVLFLRPTESLTVFLQQLGRGLRLHEEKECLTVLDFIGQAHQNFSYEMRFRALMDCPRHRIDVEIDDGCLHLPLGCVIQLERVAQKYILDNIRAAVSANRTTLVRRIKTFEADSGQHLSLQNFVYYYRLNMDEIYRRSSWAQLCAEAGMANSFAEPDALILGKGIRRIAHADSVPQINTILRILEMSADEADTFLSSNSDALRRMKIAVCSLFSDVEQTDALKGFARILRNPTLMEELRNVLEIRLSQVEAVAPQIALPFDCSLDLHSSYTLDEILTGFGYDSEKRRRSVRQGVIHLPDARADAFFVTLNKSENDYSPTTMYEDYAVSDTLFHWQSQSTTGETSDTGQRYILHEQKGYTPVLFVREHKTKDGLSCPYSFLGPLAYVSHTGSRPMSILWRLKYPIPARLLAIARRMLAA